MVKGLATDSVGTLETCNKLTPEITRTTKTDKGVATSEEGLPSEPGFGIGQILNIGLASCELRYGQEGVNIGSDVVNDRQGVHDLAEQSQEHGLGTARKDKGLAKSDMDIPEPNPTTTTEISDVLRVGNGMPKLDMGLAQGLVMCKKLNVDENGITLRTLKSMNSMCGSPKTPIFKHKKKISKVILPDWLLKWQKMSIESPPPFKKIKEKTLPKTITPLKKATKAKTIFDNSKRKKKIMDKK